MPKAPVLPQTGKVISLELYLNKNCSWPRSRMSNFNPRQKSSQLDYNPLK